MALTTTRRALRARTTSRSWRWSGARARWTAPPRGAPPRPRPRRETWLRGTAWRPTFRWVGGGWVGCGTDASGACVHAKKACAAASPGIHQRCPPAAPHHPTPPAPQEFEVVTLPSGQQVEAEKLAPPDLALVQVGGWLASAMARAWGRCGLSGAQSARKAPHLQPVLASPPEVPTHRPPPLRPPLLRVCAAPHPRPGAHAGGL